MRGSVAITRPATSRSRGRRARSRAARRPRRARRSGTGEHDELGDPHPRLDHERLARVGVEQDRPAARRGSPASIRPGRVHDRDPVPRGEARARLHEARVALGDRDGERRCRRAPAPRVRARARSQAARSRPASPAYARSGSDSRPARSRWIGSSITRLGRVAWRRSATRNGAKRRSSRRGSRARTSTPSRPVDSLVDRRAERVQLGELARPRRTARAAARPRSGRRSAPRCAARSSSRPSPVRAETCSASGKRFASRRRPQRVDARRPCSARARAAARPRRSRPSTDVDRVEHARRARSSAREASATCRTRSATSVSSSVAAKPSTSWCGSRRMKPTVSVTR